MPDTKPTPTVIVTASDKALVARWFRSSPGDISEAHALEAKMATEIAAAREAWGVPREAVAELVEAAERVRDCAKHPAIRDLVAKGWELWSSNTSGAMNAFYDAATVQLRAALERVKGVAM